MPSHHLSHIVQLILATLVTTAFPASTHADDSCFEFFQSLSSGSSGICADVSFFGFNGTTTTDLSLPHSQWQERGAVSGKSTTVNRDFTTDLDTEFFALRVTQQ